VAKVASVDGQQELIAACNYAGGRDGAYDGWPTNTARQAAERQCHGQQKHERRFCGGNILKLFSNSVL
jgi:hypothetical protein